MALRAEYELGCDALPLVSVAAGVPAADIALEIGPGAGKRPTFAATVAGDRETIEAVEDAFALTAFVGESTLVHRDGDVAHYVIRPGTSMAEQLGDRLDDLQDLRALYDCPVRIDEIHTTPTGWIQRARFADRAAFDELRTFWQRNGVGFALRRLTRDDADDRFGTASTADLTDAQRRAIGTAHELGYFEIPRTATLKDVAAELGITASSLSERLRRAQTKLVEAHFETHEGGTDPTGSGPHLKGRTTERTI